MKRTNEKGGLPVWAKVLIAVALAGLAFMLMVVSIIAFIIVEAQPPGGGDIADATAEARQDFVQLEAASRIYFDTNRSLPDLDGIARRDRASFIAEELSIDEEHVVPSDGGDFDYEIDFVASLGADRSEARCRVLLRLTYTENLSITHKKLVGNASFCEA